MPNGKLIAHELHNSNRFRKTLFGKDDKYADQEAINKHEDHLDNFALINENSVLSKEQMKQGICKKLTG